MLGRHALPPGDHALELACGPGGLGLPPPPAWPPGGAVVLSDVVAEMGDRRGRRRQHGPTTSTARALDLEDIDEPDDSFDVVLCREG